MTMPHERTRSFRWGFEFLGEMLTDETEQQPSRSKLLRMARRNLF